LHGFELRNFLICSTSYDAASVESDVVDDKGVIDDKGVLNKGGVLNEKGVVDDIIFG
jgi:hypothetical protein